MTLAEEQTQMIQIDKLLVRLLECMHRIMTVTACDSACNGCTDLGPEHCKECNKGYHMKDSVCTGNNTISSHPITKAIDQTSLMASFI